MKYLIITLILAAHAWGQPPSAGYTSMPEAKIDAALSATVRPAAHKASDPATCAVGEVIYRTDLARHKLCISANVWQLMALVPAVTVSTSGPVAVAATGFYLNNAAGALTFTLPAITADGIGKQYCFRQSPTRTGAITLQLPASTYSDKDGTNGTAAGTVVSGGAAGDAACVVAISTTQYVLYVGNGSWTNN